MRKSIREKLRDARKEGVPQQAFDGLDGFFNHLLGGKMNPTQRRFIYGSEFCSGYKGPAGCAKTSSGAAKILGRAVLVPGSKMFVSRADYNKLMDTTLDTMQAMLNRLPEGVLLDRDKSPPMKWWIRPLSVQGSPSDEEVSSITFMGLHDALGSIQATGWFVDEADEIEEKRAREIMTRLRAAGDERDYFAAFAFNPPSKTHWLYTACTGFDAQEVKQAEPWMHLYEPDARENVQNLPTGYYERMAENLPADMRARLVEGKWGSTFEGQPVYREFKEALHVKRGLLPIRGKTIYRYWDFGYNRPACVFAQLDPYGRLKALREVIGHMEEAKKFARRVQAVGAEHFPNASFMDYGDPAVKQMKDTGQTLSALREEGITMFYREGEKIATGVDIIRRRLEIIIDGEAALQFDEHGCPVLIDALKGGYRLDRTGEKPFKDGFYEHVADAYRYGIHNTLAGGYTSGQFSSLPASLEYDASKDT